MFDRVVVLAPHLDDAELGCGGTIAKLVEEGSDVYYHAFAYPSGVSRDVIQAEGERSRNYLKLPEDHFVVHDHEVRHLPSVRQEILETMIDIKQSVRPDLVLMPSLQDLHQDHRTIAEEGLRAFKHSTILGWEQPWNQISSHTSAFIELEPRHVETKILAATCYESQNGRKFFEPDFIRGFACTRGVQVNVSFAEAYEVIRFIMYLPERKDAPLVVVQ